MIITHKEWLKKIGLWVGWVAITFVLFILLTFLLNHFALEPVVVGLVPITLVFYFWSCYFLTKSRWWKLIGIILFSITILFNLVCLLPGYPTASAFAATRILGLFPLLAGIFLILQKGKLLRLFGVLVILVNIAVFLLSGLLSMMGSTTVVNNGADLNTAATATPTDIILGASNAPVILIEYGDYQCPACAQFYNNIQPGAANHLYRHWKSKINLSRNELYRQRIRCRCEAAQCAADQNAFWKYHDLLYRAKYNEKNGSENDGFFNTTLFVALAKQLGLDAEKFTGCLNSQKYIGLIEQGTKTAQGLGIKSTPTLFVDSRQIIGVQPFAQYQQTIDAALNAKK